MNFQEEDRWVCRLTLGSARPPEAELESCNGLLRSACAVIECLMNKHFVVTEESVTRDELGVLLAPSGWRPIVARLEAMVSEDW